MGDASSDVAVAAPVQRQAWRVWVAPTVTVVVSAGVQYLLVPLWFLLGMSLARSDASGQGGPFRACTPESVACDGPHLWMFSIVALALLGVCAFIARAGARIGRYRRRGAAFATHLAISVLAALAFVLFLAVRANLLG